MSTATRQRHRVRFIPAGRQPRAAPLRWCASLVWRNQYLPVREPPDSEWGNPRNALHFTRRIVVGRGGTE